MLHLSIDIVVDKCVFKKKENTYIITAGDPVGVPGTTNNIRILKEKEIEYFASLTEVKKKKDEPQDTLF